jgi:hypothetical protein
MPNHETQHVPQEALSKYRKNRFAVECGRTLDSGPVQNAFGQVAHTDVANAKCLRLGKTRINKHFGRRTPTFARISPVSERPAHGAAALRDASWKITFFPSPRAEKNLRRKLATPLLVLAERQLTTPLLNSCRNTLTYLCGARPEIHEQNAWRRANDVAVFQHEKKFQCFLEEHVLSCFRGVRLVFFERHVQQRSKVVRLCSWQIKQFMRSTR